MREVNRREVEGEGRGEEVGVVGREVEGWRCDDDGVVSLCSSYKGEEEEEVEEEITLTLSFLPFSLLSLPLLPTPLPLLLPLLLLLLLPTPSLLLLFPSHPSPPTSSLQYTGWTSTRSSGWASCLCIGVYGHVWVYLE